MREVVSATSYVMCLASTAPVDEQTESRKSRRCVRVCVCVCLCVCARACMIRECKGATHTSRRIRPVYHGRMQITFRATCRISVRPFALVFRLCGTGSVQPP